MNSSRPAEFHVDTFVRLLSRRAADQPMTMAFEDAWNSERKGLSKDTARWYHNQKEHVLAWFSSQVTRGAGAYSRNTPNASARTTYNRLLNPAMILWIAEALDEDPKIVQEAGERALTVPPRSRAATARKVLPWSRIAALANTLQEAYSSD